MSSSERVSGLKLSKVMKFDLALIPAGMDTDKMKLVVDSVRELKEPVEALAKSFPDRYLSSYMINFLACEARNSDRIEREFELDTEEPLEVLDWSDAKGMQFSHRVDVYVDSTDEMPMDGDILEVVLEYATDRATGDYVYGKFDVNGADINEETPANVLSASRIVNVKAFRAVKAVRASKAFGKRISKATSEQVVEPRATAFPIPEDVEAKVKTKEKA
jgi:hypothetical protein